MKIVVGLSNGQEYELSKNILYKDAEDVAIFINTKRRLYGNFLRAIDGTIIMPKQVIYIREEE